MRIKVMVFTTLRELAGKNKWESELEEGSNLAELIQNVALTYGKEALHYIYVRESGKIDPSIQFLINGVSAQNLQGFETELKEGDVVAIIPPVGGG